MFSSSILFLICPLICLFYEPKNTFHPPHPLILFLSSFSLSFISTQGSRGMKISFANSKGFFHLHLFHSPNQFSVRYVNEPLSFMSPFVCDITHPWSQSFSLEESDSANQPRDPHIDTLLVNEEDFQDSPYEDDEEDPAPHSKDNGLVHSVIYIDIRKSYAFSLKTKACPSHPLYLKISINLSSFLIFNPSFFPSHFRSSP